MTLLISEKVNTRAKKTASNKEGHDIMIKRLVYPKYVTIISMHLITEIPKM